MTATGSGICHFVHLTVPHISPIAPTQQRRPVYVQLKPEHQMPYGLEQTTHFEAIQAWLSSYLRPRSCLLRGDGACGHGSVVLGRRSFRHCD